MKSKLKNKIYSFIRGKGVLLTFSILLMIMPIRHLSASDKQSIIALTPQQLDESLQITKEEIELEHALQMVEPAKADLNNQIDSLKNETAEVPVSSASLQHQEKITQENEEQEFEAEDTNVSVPSVQEIAPTPRPTPTILAPAKAQKTLTKKNTPSQTRLPAEPEKVEFHFEDADLQNLITQISELFHVTFIVDDMIQPLPRNGKAIKGNKISFKTNKPLSKQQAWNLFITFLGVSELAVVKETEPNIYRIVSTTLATTSPLPTYIGVRAETLPDSDQLVRYLYFLENISIDMVSKLMESLRSPASKFIVLNDLNAFILVDRAYNIKSLMAIISELDRVTLPQSMSVIKLKRADAQDVKKLYDSLAQGDDGSITARLFPTARKASSMLYFSESVRIIAEPRTNALIMLGPQDAIKKIEEFIFKFVDIELGEETFSPLRVYQLKYADARTVVAIMNDVVQFGKNTAVGRVGGVRDGDKYIKSLSFIPEPDTNSIVIKGDEEDWQRAKVILDSLDQPQPQVALEVLILTVDMDDTRELGTALRAKATQGINGLVGNNVKFQTSGIRFGGAPNSFALNNTGSGVNRLLGNLLTLLGPSAIPGNTVVTLGSDSDGVWGIFDLLQTISNTQVVSNPYLVAANKQDASVAVGLTRRVLSANVISAAASSQSFSDSSAMLEVKVKPQINSDGMIVLDLDVTLNQFSEANNPSSGNQTTRNVKTTTIVADGEVLALGGLIQNTTVTAISKVPILGDIPIIGWLFKNEHKELIKQNLLILVSSRILHPTASEQVITLTQERIKDYYGTLDDMHGLAERRDPIHRFFFDPGENSAERSLDDFLFNRQKETKTEKAVQKNRRKARRERRKRKKEQQSPRGQEGVPLSAQQQRYAASSHPKTPVILGLPNIPPKNTISQEPLVVAQQAPPPPPQTGKKRLKPSLSQLFVNEQTEGRA